MEAEGANTSGSSGTSVGWAEIVWKGHRARGFEGFGENGMVGLVIGLREVETDDSKKRPLD